MSDPEIGKLERQFPTKSGEAFAAARKQALDAGLSVVESENGAIYEIFPDGRRVFLKAIEPPKPAVMGTTYLLR